MRTARSRHWLNPQTLGIVSALIACAPLQAALPKDAAGRSAVVGQPAALAVAPGTIALSGPRAVQQIVVTGRYTDGTERDLTSFCEFRAEPAGVVDVAAGGFLKPLQDGQANLIVQSGGQTARVAVTVAGFAKPQPVSFHSEFVAAMNVGGCNSGACHGTPSGKNGFRLSLRGYDPDADYLQLTRDILGRRTDRLQPQNSLILQKALGLIPHEGGQRFQTTSIPAETMRQWLAEGLQNDAPGFRAATSIEVLPGSRVLGAPARWQQLAVLAHYADGSIRDVTRLTVFTSSDTAVADVSPTGLVEFSQGGEAAILCRYLELLLPVRLTYLEPRPGFHWSNPPENNFVDRYVFSKLKLLNIVPSDLCTDQDFLRRAYLDVCGVLPTPEETRAFLADSAKDKRAKLIDTLLQRPEYGDFWTLKWMDVLRSSRKSIKEKGVHVYQQWLHRNIAENVPFDQIVHHLLTANGNSFNNPPANYYRIARDPTNLAESTAQLFFGIRMQCAKCHNHPFERWTQDDYYSMAAFFARVKVKVDPETTDPQNRRQSAAEVVYNERNGEVVQPRTGKTMPPRFMGGSVPPIPAGKDRREVFADWLVSANNPFFAKSVVNRIWFHVCGRGIVDPVDDFRDSNPSANDALLDALAKDFVEHHFDLQHVIRTIMNSRTYQLSAQTNDFNKDDSKYFSHAVTRPLTAEQLLDAICFATGVPEKFPGLPLGTRATQLPDGEINNQFLKTFGQPGRELACECEREGDSNLAQALQLINGPTINEKLRNTDNRVGKLLSRKLSDADMLKELYLAVLTRPPESAEVQTNLDYVAKAADKRKAWEDVLWALINAKEFLFRH